MHKEKRFLITTALEETWVEDQPVLFLGEWCRLYSRKDQWSKLNATVQIYHWDDREKLHSDYQYMNSFYERVLKDLSCKLNQIHGVEYSSRYWRILVGPWLAYFVHIIFDRWLSIENALNSFEITGTVVISQENYLVPNDMNQFVDLVLGDEWNHFIYAALLRKLSNVPTTSFVAKKKFYNHKFNKTELSFKKLGVSIYSGIVQWFVRDNDVFIINTYLTRFNEVLLQLRLGQIPQLWVSVKPPNPSLDLQKRAWEMSIQGQSIFESFLLSMIPKQIPKVYLEGYQELVAQIHSLPWPKSPKIIYSSNILWDDVVSMMYTAEKVEQGARLVYGQHGGGYGTAKFHFAEEHEIEISDRYITWGWHRQGEKKIRPVGITKVANRAQRSFKCKNTLLLITLGMPRYSFRLCAESATNYQNYISRTFSFVEKLKGSVLSGLLVRLALSDQGQGAFLRWHERFPNIQVDVGLNKITNLMQEARLVVLTYNQTGMLESLASGIPTILFCDLKVTPLCEMAIPYYAELKGVGIFHDTPESAALHVNMVWSDVDAWWCRVDVQDAVTHFTNEYCRRSKNILDGIENVLRDVIEEISN